MRALLLATLSLFLCSSQAFALEEESGEYYFLILEGRGMPVKQVILNGTNVLGGSVLSVKMPINVTDEIVKGLNELEVDFVSDTKVGLTTRIERRTEGPKVTEVVKLSSKAGESDGKLLHKTLSFNLSKAPYKEKELKVTDDDKKVILSKVQEYYEALKGKDAGKLRDIYSKALKKEGKICPENADYFNKVLKKEIALLRRDTVTMSPFSTDDVMLEVEENVVKVLRKDRKPLMQSNEIELEVEPLLTEVGETSSKPKEKVKQRLVTTKLLFKKSEGEWHLALPHGV